MKKLLIASLYVGGIVGAVAVGGWQVGVENLQGSATELPECSANVIQESCGSGVVGGGGDPCYGDTAYTAHNVSGALKSTYSASSNSSEPRQCIFPDKKCTHTFPHLTVNWAPCTPTRIP